MILLFLEVRKQRFQFENVTVNYISVESIVVRSKKRKYTLYRLCRGFGHIF